MNRKESILNVRELMLCLARSQGPVPAACVKGESILGNRYYFARQDGKGILWASLAE